VSNQKRRTGKDHRTEGPEEGAQNHFSEKFLATGVKEKDRMSLLHFEIRPKIIGLGGNPRVPGKKVNQSRKGHRNPKERVLDRGEKKGMLEKRRAARADKWKKSVREAVSA